jgi:hypothetical protein
MKKMNMEWINFKFENNSKKNVKILYCIKKFNTKGKLRHSKIKKMEEGERVRYNYCLPYLINLKEEEADNNTEVMINTVINGKGISFTFDWDIDNFDDFVEDLFKEHELTSEKDQEKLKNLLKNDIKEAKTKIKIEKQKKKEILDLIPEVEKKAISNLKFFKFYPKNNQVNIDEFKSAYINRYYGKAHKVY